MDRVEKIVGYRTIEVPAEVVELEKGQVPLRSTDRKSSPGCKPQWEVRGRKLYVQAATFRVPIYESEVKHER